MLRNETIDVIIPLYRPDHKFDELVKQLLKQSVRPDTIILLNTVDLPDYTTESIRKRVEVVAKKSKVVGKGEVRVRLLPIDKAAFDHGGTRAYGASKSCADYLVFMTQDAIPKNERMLAELLVPFWQSEVVATYAKQEAYEQASLLEKYTRLYNYPSRDVVKSATDKKRLGLKTYFCSNVCAAYRRETYEELGGFVKRTIFNEDMIYAAKVIEHGYSIAYASKACVIHSHKYSYLEQLRRNFDLGVSQEEYKEVFANVSSEKEGFQFLNQTMRYLYDQREYVVLIDFILESGFKYLGYALGKHHTFLFRSAKRWLSMNKTYWN